MRYYRANLANGSDRDFSAKSDAEAIADCGGPNGVWTLHEVTHEAGAEHLRRVQGVGTGPAQQDSCNAGEQSGWEAQQGKA